MRELAPTPRPPRLTRSGSILVLYGALALLGVVWSALRGHPQIYRVTERWTWTPWTPSHALLNLLAGLGVGLVIVALTRLASSQLAWARSLHNEFRHLLGPLSDREILVLALASSIGEECFFRGALVPHVGVVASSVLFALPHIGPGARFLPWTITSFVVGLAMGALFTLGGDLGGPIAAHFIVNYLNLHHIRKAEA